MGTIVNWIASVAILIQAIILIHKKALIEFDTHTINDLHELQRYDELLSVEPRSAEPPSAEHEVY